MPRTMTTVELIDLTGLHARGEIEQNFAFIEQTVSSDPVLEMPTLGLRVEGLEAWREYYQRQWAEGMSLPKVDMLGRWAASDDDVVFTESLSPIRVRDRFFGITFDGEREFDIHVVGLHFFADGRMTRKRIFIDTDAIRRALAG